MTGAAPFLCAVHPLRTDGKAPLSSGDCSTRVGAGTVTPVEVVDSGGAYSDSGQLAVTGWAGYLADLGVGGIGTWFYDDDDEPDWIQSDDGWRIPWGRAPHLHRAAVSAVKQAMNQSVWRKTPGFSYRARDRIDR